MLPELLTAAVLMTQHNYPFESTVNYHAYIERSISRVEVIDARQKARMEARQQARKEARQKARQEAALQAQQQPAPTEAPTPVYKSIPSSSLPSLLALIRSNESGGNYSAYNASGCGGYGCYGAYQLHGYYMDDWARRYGAAAYAGIPANQWPPAIQDKVALGLFYSTSPNGSFWCDWTSYC